MTYNQVYSILTQTEWSSSYEKENRICVKFIIVFVKSDVEKFFKKHGIWNGDYEIRSVEEIYMTEGTKYAIGFIDYEIPLDKFDSKDLLLLVAIANNEGDSDGVFYREEDDYDSG